MAIGTTPPGLRNAKKSVRGRLFFKVQTFIRTEMIKGLNEKIKI